MDKESYLKELKAQLYSLTEEEQSEAMEYYTSYFDEAEDFEKAAKELGTPEELAATIKEKIAGVPAKTANKKEEKKDSEEQENRYSGYDKSGWNKVEKYTFEKSQVKNWDFNFGAAQIVIVPNKASDEYVIEARNIDYAVFSCDVSSHGTLMVSNKILVNGGLFSFNRNNENRPSRKNPPRILLKVPASCSLEKVKLNMSAGSLEMRDVEAVCREAYVSLGAGEVKLAKLLGGKLKVKCGMGNLKLEGSCSGESSIDCGMGNVDLYLSGNAEDYAYSASVGLGEFSFNKAKKSGFGSIRSEQRKDLLISANVGMGKVSILMGDSYGR